MRASARRSDTRTPMPHILPPLPYAYDALAPTVDELTLRLHHGKHHGEHVAALNAALAGTEWADHPVEQLLRDLSRLPEGTRDAVRYHGGGHANHTLLWESMTPDPCGGPAGPLADEIATAFGSVPELKRRLGTAGVAHPGSGWVWLIRNGGGLGVVTTPNHDSPLLDGHAPLLGVDMWEHAYYLKHQNRRADYLEAWWNVVDWRRVAERYAVVARERP